MTTIEIKQYIFNFSLTLDNSFCSGQNHHTDNTGQGWNEVADTFAAVQTCKQKKKDLHLLKINIYQDLEHQGFTINDTEEKLKKRKLMVILRV